MRSMNGTEENKLVGLVSFPGQVERYPRLWIEGLVNVVD
jgi:hypothetical protein